MAALTPALKGLFASIDVLWPHRDRRTDGWYRAPSAGKSVGHNPGHNGYSHAIDVDKDGINPMWIINHIARGNGVMFYIIWDVRVWSVETGWNGHPYHIPKGGSDHRDHLHIETYQTNGAEQFRGPWFTDQGGSAGLGPADPGSDSGIGGLGAADPRDYRGPVYASGGDSRFVGGRLNEITQYIQGTRGF
jgi:hypothetical protein